MKVILFSIGTRGDMEPFLAIAEILASRNWEITCVFPEQFKDLVESLGYGFHGFDKAFLELLESSTGKNMMGGEGNLFEKARNLFHLGKKGIKLNKEMVAVQAKILREVAYDLAIYHPKCSFLVVWAMQNPTKAVMISPIPYVQHPSRKLSVISLRGNGNYGTSLNLLSYSFVNWTKSTMVNSMTKPHCSQLKGVKISASRIREFMLEKERTLYAISPSLFEKPREWGNQIEVVGYFERNKTIDWQPDAELKQFVERHDKILLVTFGSISNKKPKEKTDAILAVLQKHKIPTIINTSWGGLEKRENAPEHVHFVNSIPYDWIFPKVYGVMHHGGSGTTHTALKYGCANLIIPHIVDQFYWNRNLAEKELAPLGISINKLTSENLESRLLSMWNNPKFKQNAEEFSQKMALENDEQKYYEELTRGI